MFGFYSIIYFVFFFFFFYLHIRFTFVFRVFETLYLLPQHTTTLEINDTPAKMFHHLTSIICATMLLLIPDPID